MKNKVIFILGTGHCGSTLLDLILGSHSDTFSLGEIYTVLKKVMNEPLCDLCVEECEIWTPQLRKKLKQCYNPNLIQRIISKINLEKTTETRFYEHIYKKVNQPILIDSSKNAGWIYRNGEQLYKSNKYEPILLYLSRDGRAVINSYYRKYPEKEIENIAHNWNNRIEKINKCFSDWGFAKKIHIKYEDIAKEPVETIQKILGFLDIDYQPQMMRFWEHQHHLVNGNAGTKSMILKFQKQHLHKDWINNNKKGYYKNHELGIKFDERWRNELNNEQLAVINGIIGEFNKDLID